MPLVQYCRIFAALGLTLLTACGGGGGGDAPQTPAPTPPPTNQTPDPGSGTASYSASGQLLVLAEAVLDADTNNPDNPPGDNSTPNNAQLLPNPASIGGYLASAGDGEAGPLSADGDLEDFYLIDGFAGQRISLVVADSDIGDVDLYLYSDEGFIEAFSAGIGDIEEVTVPRDGRWFVNPSLYVDPQGVGGASNYTMTIGAAGLTASQSTPSSIIAGELIVELSGEQVLRSEIIEDRGRRVLKQANAEWRGGARGRARRLQQKSAAATGPISTQQQDKARALAHNPALKRQWETWQLAKQVAAMPEVARVEPNRRMAALRETNDEFASLQWEPPAINLPAAWDFTVGESDVIVAVVDTGVVLDHPDLQSQLVPGYDFVANASTSGDGDGLDDDPTDDGAANSDDIGTYSYHGTHVTGIVAAAGNNQVGIAGVAYGSRAMPLRALGGDSGSTFDILQAIRFAAGLENDSGRLPARPANIINLSLGSDTASAAERDLLDSIVASGTVIVAAAGNEGNNELSYPARYDSVIAVGATDIESALTVYSNTGSGLDLVAPGGDGGNDRNGDGYPDAILSTGVADDDAAYTFLSGTSMAAPVVSGVLALMQSINPDLGPDGLVALLEQGALTVDLGAPGYDLEYGWGQIDAQKAVLAAIDSLGQTPSRPARLTASTGFVNLGAVLGGFDITLDNRGTSALQVTEARSNAAWLSASAEATDSNGLGRWRIRADRQVLAEGQYRGQLTFASTVNEVTVEVALRVSSETSGNVGVLYVLFYDPAADDVVFQTVTDENGNYQYSGDIPQGTYEIWAGTDNDNDQFICDAGESCGAYKTLDAPVLITLDGNRSGLDFPSDYRIELQSTATVQAGQVQTARPGLKRLN